MKYEHKRQFQISTWLRDFPLELWFHVRGNPNQAEEYIFDLSEHLITVNVSDDYVSLPKKTYMALKAVRETFPSITHVLKTDDDVTCNIPALGDLLKTLPAYDYGGALMDVQHSYMSVHHYFDSVEKKPQICLACNYANGLFYFLSARGIDHIITQKDLFWSHIFEDNVVGYALKSLPNAQLLSVKPASIFSLL